jgi:NhaC family Na+:H+ antiporter
MLLVGTIVAFGILIGCVLHQIPLGYALLGCWLIFSLIARRELTWRQILQFSWQGAKTSWGVIKTLLLIGATIGIWMASGTIATIVYDACLLINPHYFIPIVFLVCAAVSFVIGTSFGTVSVVGLPLMLIAKSGAINLDMVAGAIIAGIYFGDRCSPLSSSASLVATLSMTNLFRNIKNMFKTSWVALLVSVGGYFILGNLHPLNHLNRSLLTTLRDNFHISWLMLIPAAIILILSVFRRPISESILISIVSALLIGVFSQHTALGTLLTSLFLEFNPGPHQLIQGGGMISMVNPLSVVFLSCAIAGIFDHLDSFKQLQTRLAHPEGSPAKRFGITVFASLVTAGIGCNQSVAIIMTNTLVKRNYPDQHDELAMGLENTAVLLAPVIPWNIAVFVPIAILGTSFTGYLPYAFYLYLVPIFYGCWQLLRSKQRTIVQKRNIR